MRRRRAASAAVARHMHAVLLPKRFVILEFFVVVGNVMQIWARDSLPSFEELQPEPALLASSETIPTRAQMRMQRWPGKRSYCHTIGKGCGGPQHRQAWEELSTELDHNARALALHFVDDQCKDLPPERRAASARFVELLLTTGLELLCSVASKLHSLEVEQCWAWCAR